MNKAELVKEIRDRVGEDAISLRTTEKALEAFMQAVICTVSAGEEVRLIGFGTFKAVKMALRSGYNPATQERMVIPSRVAPKFVPGTAFKEDVKNAPVRG